MKSYIIDILKGINSKDQEITYKELHNIINTASEDQSTTIKLYSDTEKNYTAVFSWQHNNKWKIDYPIQLHKIHKQRYVSHQQCLQLAEHIYNDNSLDDLKGFIDVPVRHFTLDEMLQFKKEDEMMLKGEDPDLLIPAPTSYQKPEISEKPKNNLAQKRHTKPSSILGGISVPKEQPRAKSTSRVTAKKKLQSPLKQFKESTKQLKKEKKQPGIAKAPVKPITKKAYPPKPIPAKTGDNSLLHPEKTINPKKNIEPSLVIGEQLGKKQDNAPSPSKPKTAVNTQKTKKPSNDDSFFSI